MPITQIDTFSIERLQILDEKGNVDKALEPKLSNEELKRIYYLMLLSRAFDEKAINLQRQGKIGTFAPVKGQEASQIGSAYALSQKDWVFPTYRESAALITRGLPISQLIQYWAGSEYGNDTSKERNNFPISIAVGTHLLHAVGVAYASKLKGDNIVTLAYFGDGATSEGDFHEALNFSGVWKTPTIFLCQNNQLAISVPRKKQTSAKTLAQKSIAYGIKGMQVDGNDIFAVYKAVKDAVDYAKGGNGATLIECETYRLAQHTTSDDPSKYLKKEELEQWLPKEPIIRFESYLKNKRILTDDEIKKLKERAEQEVKKGVELGLSEIKNDPDDMFKFLFADMPRGILQQMNELKETLRKNG